ncbi:IS110 family transposase [Nonomuraea jiangxiensis]|uniref:Transposase IS116/IS110/IS902 family protein n=1 Tax=Nonomuraea jiangxiensis TaxID=633440 RepID=A0A1G8BXC1_9ACTN|nr:IS110 family transposase [Nonomuraea jiangxiensis]SDH37768.1 Transposase IS116/IS110/IS902 family protein [Nonomuraea jiangxiensis]
MQEVDEQDLYVDRVAALDLGKAGLEACVRVPHEDRPGRRMQEIRAYATTTTALLEMADWLRCQSVSRVVMESTSDYWKGVFWLLEAEGFDCWLVNARQVKNVPGRAKTDKADAVWLAKVAERGMCRPSLVQPAPIRKLRDLTRYRRSLIEDRTREMQRAEKLLEDAQVKLSSVISDIFGVSGRQMLQALIDGQRDPKVLAGMARGSMRGKIPQLEEALRGFFTDHHAVLLRIMLAKIDRLSDQAALLDAEIEQAISPFSAQAAQLDEITGVGQVAAQELIAEIGVEMSRFPTAAHLVSWAKFCPQTHESAGRKKGKGRGKDNRWLAGTLGRIVFSFGKTDTFLGERYRRIARRRGKSKALVAAGNSVLTVIHQLLSDPQAHFHDLGANYYDSRINKDRRARSLASQLQALTGQKIVIRNGKAVLIEPEAA